MGHNHDGLPQVAEALSAVGYILDVSPADLSGYIVVGQLTAGGMDVTSNICCEAHLVAALGEVLTQTGHTLAAGRVEVIPG